MIIVKLAGGLGNQMFQYAAGKQLATLHGAELKFDKGALGSAVPEGVTPRNVELDLLNVNLSWASENEISDYSSRNNNAYLRWLQRKFSFLFRKIYFAESGMAFQTNFFKLPANVYLVGYWQSERYFKKIRFQLLNEFKPKKEFSTANSEWISKIASVNSVSLHIRRGDYVSNPQAAKFHGVLSMSYYEKAVSVIKESIVNPEFFIFSDDVEWAKSNLKFSYPLHFVEQNSGKDAVFDLALMSACKHNIIANSSFSWWGAWLNSNENKIVIAPKQWFADAAVYSPDLVPVGWKRH